MDRDDFKDSNKLKNLTVVLDQYTLLDSSQFFHCDIGSSTVKTHGNKSIFVEEKYW